MTSTQVLRDLEISLRTNNIQLVEELVADICKLFTIIPFIPIQAGSGIFWANSTTAWTCSFRTSPTLSPSWGTRFYLRSFFIFFLELTRSLLYARRCSRSTRFRSEVMSSSLEHDSSHSSTLPSAVPSRSSFLGISASSVMRKMKQSHSKLGLADAVDDIHVGVQCLRAIMNHQVFLTPAFFNAATSRLSSTSVTRDFLSRLAARLQLGLPTQTGHQLPHAQFKSQKFKVWYLDWYIWYQICQYLSFLV